MPTFTIITATYNAAQTLPRLLESLAAQTYRNFSVILQDGGSNDETLALAESYRSRLPLLSIESAPDNGIYDAWNKALDRAGQRLGDWVLFLGADDLLASNTVLEEAHKFLMSQPKTTKFAVGKIRFLDSEGRAQGQDLSVMISHAFKNRYKGTPLPHTALLHNKCIFKKQRFDASYAIAGDYELMLRVWDNENECQKLPVVLSIMALGGVSSHEKTKKIMQRELYKISSQYFPVKGRIRFFLVFIKQYFFKYIKKNK